MMMMMGESVPVAIWAAVSSWFTPTVLFVVLNIVIGTIAVSSKLSHSQKNNTSSHSDGSTDEGGGGIFEAGHEGHHLQPRLLSRGSSILARLKSMNLHRHVSSAFAPPTTETLQPPEDAAAVTASSRQEEPEIEVVSDSNSAGFETMEEAYMAARRGSDCRRTRSDTESLQKKVVVKELRKTATAKAREEEGEVDARADDFINRFKKQLQLQRLESLVRYKEMLSRGNLSACAATAVVVDIPSPSCPQCS